MANRLSDQLSPYLLQHRDNPVEWWPWSVGALDEAKARDVPILLSIGHASSEACRRLASECFADPDAADLINAAFISVVVDAEQRLQARRNAGGEGAVAPGAGQHLGLLVPRHVCACIEGIESGHGECACPGRSRPKAELSKADKLTHT